MTLKPIIINENTIRRIVSESIRDILKENKFRNPYTKMQAMAHAKARETGEDPHELYDKWSKDFNAKTTALSDINKDITKRRNAEVNDFDDEEFYRAVNPSLFDEDDFDNGLFGDNMGNPDSGKFADDVYDDGDSDLYYKG
jgi:hypothetical protein